MTMPRHDTHATALAADLDGAFPAFLRDTIDGVYSGVRRLAPLQVEDITQETYVRAYRALQGYEPARIRSLRLNGWLWTIALNLCRNAARSAARRPALVGLDSVAEPPSSETPEGVAMSRVEAEAWQQRLEGLTQPIRQAVVLRHVVGLTYAEIAEALDRPIGTVKADVHRGIERLRTTLMNEQESRDD